MSGYDGIRHKYNLQETFDETESGNLHNNPSTMSNLGETTQNSESSNTSKPKSTKKYQNAQSSSKTKSFLQEMKKKGKKDAKFDDDFVVLVDSKKPSDLPDNSSVAGSGTGTLGHSEGDVLHQIPESNHTQDQTTFEQSKTHRKRSQSLTEELGLKFKEEDTPIQELSQLKTKKTSETEQNLKETDPKGDKDLHDSINYSDLSVGSPILHPTGHPMIPPPPDLDELKYVMSVPDPEAKKCGSPEMSQRLLDKITRAEQYSTASQALHTSAIPLHAAPRKSRPEAVEKRLAEMVDANEDELIETYLKDGPLVYQLAGVLIHKGGAYGGHYYAYIRSFEDGEWHCFDDSRISKVSKRHVAEASFGGKNTSESGYMLFYQVVEEIAFDDKWLEIPKELKETCTLDLTFEREQGKFVLLSCQRAC